MGWQIFFTLGGGGRNFLEPPFLGGQPEAPVQVCTEDRNPIFFYASRVTKDPQNTKTSRLESSAVESYKVSEIDPLAPISGHFQKTTLGP